MENLFISLYPLVAVISIIAYLPQIKLLVFAKAPPDNIALSSWILWCFSNIITLGYGIYHVQDILFCITVGVSTLLIAMTIALILYNRYIRFQTFTEIVDTITECISEASPETITESISETISESIKDIIPDVMLPETVAERGASDTAQTTKTEESY